MSYITRNKLYEKIPANSSAKKIYIICEGQKREIQYFNFFQGLSSNVNIIPIPSQDGYTDPQMLQQLARQLFFTANGNTPAFSLDEENNDEVWFAIDTDRWNENNKINLLRVFCTQHVGFYVAQSNPCFEIWLYYHQHAVKPRHEEVITYTTFKEYVAKAVKGGFDSRKMPVALENAICNSEANYVIENDQPILYTTEVHKLGNVILPFVKNQLLKAKKMGLI